MKDAEREKEQKPTAKPWVSPMGGAPVVFGFPVMLKWETGIEKIFVPEEHNNMVAVIFLPMPFCVEETLQRQPIFYFQPRIWEKTLKGRQISSPSAIDNFPCVSKERIPALNHIVTRGSSVNEEKLSTLQLRNS
ncbi:unnamed protein product [Caenorhabditis auriculariae]|uniref:Uncharacterized protein n=1 Tax=Caenorhabditis auriculariae TaxID=2777116 RepID=A0A8S1HBI8_9PELO|nr:unnamed protein product [Caenorhabditis auriculariae]